MTTPQPQPPAKRSLFHSRHLVGLGLLFLAVLVAGGLIYWQLTAMAVPEARDLRTAVHARLAVPMVFTSRSEPASFEAAAPEAEGFHYPGTIPFAAREGRLRLLKTDGSVYELTWQREAPGGGTLVDVCGPSITTDGQKILFAGRRAAPDPGRWRIYRMNLDGSGFEQVTGTASDSGCVASPPMRYAADGSLMSLEDRQRLDYDDLDPTDDGGNGIIFASSRLPDLGRDHARRATQIWYWPQGDSAPHALTANRNNDRWPFQTAHTAILFSLWSRNREVISEDLREVVPFRKEGRYATAPTNQWVGSRVFPDGTQFGYAVKIDAPVYRPRALFNGRVVFATEQGENRMPRIAQADWGYIDAAPSSLALGSKFPRTKQAALQFGPLTDSQGRTLISATPSPMPPGDILLAAADPSSPATGFGIYRVTDDWSGSPVPELVFDDPTLVDAEPVAVYVRDVPFARSEPPLVSEGEVPVGKSPTFANQPYRGSLGLLENSMINAPLPGTFPARNTDQEKNGAIPYPTTVKSVVFYAAYRDRFDDPQTPRIPGTWEKLTTVPLDNNGLLKTWIPARPHMPTVLAGLDDSGRIAETPGVADSQGTRGRYFAIAGDHYSGTRVRGYHFCLGCHTGHTFIETTIREKVK